MKICTHCNIPKSLDAYSFKYLALGKLLAHCKECDKFKSAAYRKNNKIQIAKSKKDRYQKNKEQIKAARNQYVKANHAKVLEINRKSYKKNYPGKVDYYTARSILRVHLKTQRTPKWLTKAQKADMRSFYKEARELSWLSEGGLEVDHIVPLRGKNVSGLHVPWNLQILPTLLNRSKSNRLEPK
jgi:hypothetical protein